MTKKRNGFLLVYCVIAVLLVTTALGLHFVFESLRAGRKASSVAGDGVRTVILDAGHGGFDGGAVSVTGTPEKVLNLDTTLTLTEILLAQGYQVILTRDSDIELTSEEGGSRKMQDLRGRLAIAEEHDGIPFISIHMNKFPQSKYRGLQVYYSVNDPKGQSLASAVQSSVKTFVQSDNDREIKPATSAIYLLHNMTSPAILIECGFLSNEEEARLLEDGEYRTTLCLSLAIGFIEWQNQYQ